MSYGESTKSNPWTMAAVAAVAALVTCLAACNDAARIDVPTSPLSLEGTSPVEWSSHERISHFITASDGVRLAVDVVLPAGYTGEGEGATLGDMPTSPPTSPTTPRSVHRSMRRRSRWRTP